MDESRALKAQRQSNSEQRGTHWKALFENVHDAVLYVDDAGHFLDVNPVALDMIGYSWNELARYHFWDIIRPSGKIIGAAEWGGLLQHGQHGGESAVCRHDGSQVMVQLRVVPAIEPGIHLVLLEESRRSEEYFHALIENSPDIIAVVGYGRPARYESPSMYRVMGYQTSEVTGRELSEFVHPDDWQGVVDAYAKVLETPGAAISKEYRFRHKNGSWRWLESVFHNLIDNAAVSGIVINSRDIAERKESEARIRAAMERAEASRIEAEEANRAKSEFLSRMSHELRTPLNAILGFGQILELGKLSPAQFDHVEHILKGGRHLLALINEVLDISRIEAGRMELSLEPIALCEVVAECSDLIRPLAAEQGIVLEIDGVGPSSGHVLADRQRLKQVLINLLSNAIKYNREKGRVIVLCKTVSPERMRIEVHDTGPGIAPEDMEKLFVPFERLHAENSVIEGIGLGLVLSRRLVEVMDGTLGVESAVGHGSVFYVELPTVESPLKELDKVAPLLHLSAESNAHDCQLLYIEDNLSNSQLVEAILEGRTGTRLLTAIQGSVGLDLARQHRPDLILLDLHLPDMPGREVLRRLRTAPETANIPVVVLSADATPGQIENLLNPPGDRPRADAYLTKPLNVREFIQLMDEFLTKPG